MNEEELARLLLQNAEGLKLARTGLSKECPVPIQFSTNYFESHLPELSAMKAVWFVLMAEGRLAELQNRQRDAAQSYVDAIRFSHESVRGGFLIDRLVGIAIESMALPPLENLSQNLSATESRDAVKALKSINAKREPLEDTFEAEAVLSRRNSWTGRIALIMAFKTLHPERINEQKTRVQLNNLDRRFRMLITNLAARASELDSGDH